jgi:deferrochelatase/peroxidase EfeB
MTEYNPDDIQGNILRGYPYGQVRHIVMQIADPAAARRFLAAAVAEDDALVPRITPATHWVTPPPYAFNIGLTYEGLKVLGTPAESLASFPTEFVQGMARRAAKLGDFGASAPEAWPAPFDRPDLVHIIASVYSDQAPNLDLVQAQVTKVFRVLGVHDGRGLPDGKVFFGYKDSITQPQFSPKPNPQTPGTYLPVDPLGTALLGYSTRMENIRFSVPTPIDLGLNGCFNAFRVLAQDAMGFEAYLSQAATQLMNHPKALVLLPLGQETRIGPGLDRHAALREIVAAQMMGRWRNGVPLALSPETPNPEPPVSLTDFNYAHGTSCPAGAHIRRTNPRGGPIVQRIAHYTRRLIRRGMSYGPDFDPAKPDNQERGLLGNFICANLGAQFEAVMCDWLNLGLQDPMITSSNDPLIGANAPETSWFDLQLPFGDSIRLHGFPRFVTTRGGAYAFLPSIAAIRWLSRLPG